MDTDQKDANQPTVPLDHQLEDGHDQPSATNVVDAPAAQSVASTEPTSPAAPETTQSSQQTAEPSVGMPVTPMVSANSLSMAKPKRRFGKKMKLALVGLLAVVLLGGGGAAAYFGYIVPNKPENVLKTAFENAFKQKQSKFSGALEMSAASNDKEDPLGGVGSVELQFSGQSDAEKSIAQLEMELAVAGVKIPAEMRYVDRSIYVQLKNLSAIEGIVKGFAPDAAPLVAKVSKSLSGQWIEIDNTLLGAQADECNIAGITMTQADIDKIFEIYSKNQFTKVNKISDEKRGNLNTIRYDLTLEDNKLVPALNQTINEVEVFKKIKKCFGETENVDTNELFDGTTTPVTIWVDKDTKQIVRFGTYSNDKNEKEDNLKAKLEMDISYGAVNVVKPTTSKPLLQVAAELQELMNDPLLLELLGGGMDVDSFDPEALTN